LIVSLLRNPVAEKLNPHATVRKDYLVVFLYFIAGVARLSQHRPQLVAVASAMFKYKTANATRTLAIDFRVRGPGNNQPTSKSAFFFTNQNFA
jgi:hypothetical protein